MLKCSVTRDKKLKSIECNKKNKNCKVLFALWAMRLQWSICQSSRDGMPLKCEMASTHVSLLIPLTLIYTKIYVSICTLEYRST